MGITRVGGGTLGAEWIWMLKKGDMWGLKTKSFDVKHWIYAVCGTQEFGIAWISKVKRGIIQ